MERVKSEDIKVESKPRWQKIGGGSLRMGNRIIKPNEKFEAYPEEIPLSFRKFVIPLSGDATFLPIATKEKEKTETPKEVTKSTFEIVPHGKSLYLFDVVSNTGKVTNTKSLKKEVAEALVVDLLKGTK